MTNVVSIIDSAPPVNDELPDDTDDAIFKAAAKYLAWGWRILPFQRGAGKCYLTKEAESSFTIAEHEIAEKFAGRDVGINVGASGLVDVDIDCPKGARFAEWLLPSTATIGREGKALSHLLYRCPEVPTTSFHDLDGKEMIAVLTKNRLLLPPSIHGKTNSLLAWTHDLEPAKADAGIVETVGEIAALTLITRHWPGKHARHEPTLALSGMLVRAGWPVAKALDTVKVIAKIANDPKVADRLVEVTSTYDRHAQGKHTTGLPTLVKLLTANEDQAAAMKQRLHDWLGLNLGATTESTGADLSKYALTLSELFELKLPDIEYLVDPFLAKSSLSMVFASRGVGKTWFTLQLAMCLARGVDFFSWAVPKKRRVLLVDGEMTVSWLQYRLQALSGSAYPPPNLRIIPVANMWLNDDSLAINKQNGQQRIEQYLAEEEAKGERPDLIVFDNLSALMVGVDENNNSELDDFVRWLVKLRARGYAVLLVHHAGKNGTQRGASRREDLLETVIELKRQDSLDLGQADGACFEISFSKLRGEHPKPIRLCVALVQDGSGYPTWKVEVGQEMPAYVKTVRAIQLHKPATQVELANHLKVKKQAVNKQITIGKDKGLLMPSGLELTAKGIAEMEKWFGSEKEYEDKL